MNFSTDYIISVVKYIKYPSLLPNIINAKKYIFVAYLLTIIYFGNGVLQHQEMAMPNQIAMVAMITCAFGAAPSALAVLPKNKVLAEGPSAANIMDHVSMLNILPFGVCNSPANPMVAAATTAALGVLTPMSCIPMTPE